MARYPVNGKPNIASGFLPPGRPNHFALDLAGAAGDSVVSPESGVVVAAQVTESPERSDNTTFPSSGTHFAGYGPGVVIVNGASGKFHLLAHLAAVNVTVGASVDEGENVGAMATHVGASGPHVHWEVRSVAIDAGPATRGDFTVDPVQWLAQNPGPLDKARQAIRSAEGKRSLVDAAVVVGVLWLLTRRR